MSTIPTDWVKITPDTMPKEGDRILVFENPLIIICNYITDRVWTREKLAFLDEQDEQPGMCYPTYWMPLPKPPSE